MEKKYIIVSPYRSGLGNVLMSLEIIYAMAYITGRTLIIPPSIYTLFLNSGYSKEGYPNYWDIFNRDCVSSEFDIIDYNDFCNFPEIKGELSEYNWFDNLYKFSDSIFSEIKFPELFEICLDWLFVRIFLFISISEYIFDIWIICLEHFNSKDSDKNSILCKRRICTYFSFRNSFR